MYKTLISLIMILVMSASIGSGAPAELESVVESGESNGNHQLAEL